jgi:hypothetical protein
MKMNKRANIPIIILVIGTIALCVLALMAFQNGRDRRGSKIQAFRELRVMYNVLDDIEFSEKDLDYVKANDLYLDVYFSSFGTLKIMPLKTYKSYRPVVNELEIRPLGGRDYLVLDKKGEYTLRIPIE